MLLDVVHDAEKPQFRFPFREQRDEACAQFELAGATKHVNGQQQFHSDKGRPLTGGGGIQPDMVVYPEAMNRLRAALEGSASFTNFATEYLTHHQVSDDFEITPQLLADFRSFLADRQILPGVTEWSAEQAFVENRLKTEIFNQALGVEKGDQIEAQRDPAILKALEVLGG